MRPSWGGLSSAIYVIAYSVIFRRQANFLDKICRLWNIPCVACEVEYTDEFGSWWAVLTEKEQADVAAYVELLESRDARLGYPYSSGINGSRHSHMRELRVQSGGRPIRVFYAFDPRRMAILLIGGDKTGDDRFYETYIPIADDLYDQHLIELAKEGLLP